MKKNLFVFLLVLSFIAGCATYPVISKHDFKTQGDSVLRERLLKLTPLGTSEADVTNVIKRQLKRKPELIQMEHFPNSRPRFSRGLPDLDDKLIMSHLALHDWARGWFITGGVVTAYWWIDKTNGLVDIKVVHWSDGP